MGDSRASEFFFARHPQSMIWVWLPATLPCCPPTCRSARQFRSLAWGRRDINLAGEWLLAAGRSPAPNGWAWHPQNGPPEWLVLGSRSWCRSRRRFASALPFPRWGQPSGWVPVRQLALRALGCQGFGAPTVNPRAAGVFPGAGGRCGGPGAPGWQVVAELVAPPNDAPRRGRRKTRPIRRVGVLAGLRVKKTFRAKWPGTWRGRKKEAG